MALSDKQGRMNEAQFKAVTRRNKSFVYLYPTELCALRNSNGILENSSSLPIQTSENGPRSNRNFGIGSEVATSNPTLGPVSNRCTALLVFL